MSKKDDAYEKKRGEYLNLASTKQGQSELRRRVVNFLQFVWRRTLTPADSMGFDYFISTQKEKVPTGTLQVVFLNKDTTSLIADWDVDTSKAKVQYLTYLHMRGKDNKRITPVCVWAWGADLFWCDLTDYNIFNNGGKVPLQHRKKLNVREMYLP